MKIENEINESFEFVCKNCKSEKINSYYDSQNQRLFIICETCHNDACIGMTSVLNEKYDKILELLNTMKPSLSSIEHIAHQIEYLLESPE